jgi:L-lactate permease
MKPKDAVVTFGETLNELKVRFIQLAWCCLLLLSQTIQGCLQPWLWRLHTGTHLRSSLAFLGLVGVFLTGSDTSANALFGALQATTAQQIGVPEVLLVAANTSGGVTGKMISPQSIAIACAAVGLVGKESDLFRFTLKHSITFTIMMGIMITLQAYVFPWMIP